ncbi:TadE family type IV pilus minor pilin [Corynebacterium parakroppenstedtii]|uniref:TadE family type IV pilus minor pilin n=1 Tax=Corynebacterium parakroppenstedtii TaxID=2828363 RepID=UPI001C8F439B|nr:TadE family type IV pilus minor pilin [Corynebacterium parakroppenstedtii]MBY0794162.1 hypothetical protein [Corynebacterium parakroppenstedtii]
MNRASLSSRLTYDTRPVSSGPCIVENNDADSDAPPPNATASWWERGSVTIEAAFAISMVLVVVGMLIVGVMAVANQVAATEASANAARAIARGKNRSEVEQHMTSVVKNSTMTVATTPGAGGQPGFVKVTVTVKNPLKDAESTSVAVNEENIGSSGDAG